MPKYSDTKILQITKFSDTTKQIKRMIYEDLLDTGSVPLIEDIAREMGIAKEEVKNSLHDLEGGFILALQNESHKNIEKFMGQDLSPGTKLPGVGEIFYARPFANFKNHHKVYVDGEQKWFAECPVEATSLSYFFPGKEVIIRSVSHITNEEVELIGRDGQLLDYSPKSLRIYWGVPFGSWLNTRGHEGDFIFPCDNNFFFSSPDAYNEWKKRNSQEKGEIFTPFELNHILRIFNYGHERFDYQYHIPLLKIIAASVSTKMIKIKMGLPVPNWFFFSMIKLPWHFYKYKYRLFLDIKLW